MFQRLLLPAALLCCCSGESSVHGPPEKVQAFAGGAVILPCSFSVTAGDEFRTVEWSKEGLQPKEVFVYRDGRETHEMKNPAFHYRTSFIRKGLKNRNISLRISNVQLSDAGKYQCLKIWKNAPREITTVDLVVGAVPEPKLSVISDDSRGVTLQCEVTTCWSPEPEIQFEDAEGNNVTASDPRRLRNDSGCYTVTRRVTLQDATSSVICRVHLQEINQTRTAQIQILVRCMRSCFQTTAIAVGVTVLLLSASSCGLALFLWRRCDKSAEAHKLPVSRQSSDESTVSVVNETQSLLPSGKTGKSVSAGNGTVEKLARRVADLESKLHEKEETICQLQSKIQTQPSPIFYLSQPTIICNPTASTVNVPESQGPKPALSRQHSAPGPDHLIRRNRRPHSNPDILDLEEVMSSRPSSGNPSKKKLGDIGRSMSESSAWPVPRLQRRHSSAFPLSVVSNNRFALLAKLNEEAEQLVQ